MLHILLFSGKVLVGLCTLSDIRKNNWKNVIDKEECYCICIMLWVSKVKLNRWPETKSKEVFFCYMNFIFGNLVGRISRYKKCDRLQVSDDAWIFVWESLSKILISLQEKYGKVWVSNFVGLLFLQFNIAYCLCFFQVPHSFLHFSCFGCSFTFDLWCLCGIFILSKR